MRTEPANVSPGLLKGGYGVCGGGEEQQSCAPASTPPSDGAKKSEATLDGGHAERVAAGSRKQRAPMISSHLEACGQTSSEQAEQFNHKSGAKLSGLHERIAREIKSKLLARREKGCTGEREIKVERSKLGQDAAGQQQQQQQRAEHATGGSERAPLLSALLEGRRKSWLEQKTVIVDIKNGPAVKVKRAKSEEDANSLKWASSASSSPEGEALQGSYRRLDDSIEHQAEQQQREKEETVNGKEEEEEEEEREEEKGEHSRTLAAKVASQKSASAKQEEEQSDERKERSGEEANRNNRQPPTFGSTPTKLARLPYYSYHGKARNVELVSAKDRPSKQRAEEESSSGGEREESRREGSSRSEESQASRSSGGGGASSRIPTLSRTSNFGAAQSSSNAERLKRESEIEQEDSRELELDRRQRQRRRGTEGYSNISNLFPNQPRQLRARSADKQRQRQAFSDTRPQSAFGQREAGSGSGSGVGGGRGRQRPTLNKASSLVSLGQERRFSPSGNQASAGSATSASRAHRGGRPMSSAESKERILGEKGSMRRQSSAAGLAKRGSRAQSSQAGYLRAHHRSPSASSLHYAGGSTGVSPYGATEAECAVHGYPQGAVGPLSKSSQALAQAADPDLLYEPHYAPFYERPALKQSASLYSPTSPNLLGGVGVGAGAGLSPLGRQSQAGRAGSTMLASAQPTAYYNGSSRFSLYHSPAAGGARQTLAPASEQLRRILGYQPHAKPIYLHPQWAYSRPFIHLQGTRSPSPGSPLGDLEDPSQLGPRFEPYNQLQDTQAIRAADFHPSGEVYAIGSNSRALRICAYPADYELRHFGQDHVTTAPRILFKFLQVHRGSIYCVSFNSAGQLLATGSNDQTVHIVRYNSITHSPDGDEYRLTMHDGTVRDLCFIDDHTTSSSLLLSAGGGDNKIYVTDCDTITPFQSMAGHTQMIMGLHHWGGANFVSASYDRTIRFWDLRTRACTSIISAPPSYGTGGKWAGPGAPVCSVQVDPTGRLLASGHTDATCMLYDVRGARIIQAFKPHDDEIRTLSFSPKSYYLLTGGYDGRIVLSDLQGDLTQPLPSVCVAETDDKFVQAKWHPSDFTFVTTSADKSATLWAMPTE